MSIFSLACYAITIAALLFVAYCMVGTVMYNRSSSAYLESAGCYRRGEDTRAAELYAKAQRLHAQADRWMHHKGGVS